MTLRCARKATQDLKERTLAGAIGPDQGHALAMTDGQRGHIENASPLDLETQVPDIDDSLKQRCVHSTHNSAFRMRRDSASNAMTSAITIRMMVARRLHWNRLTASEISKPRPPAPIRPRMVESRMLNSHT